MDLDGKAMKLEVGKKYELNNGDVVTMEPCNYNEGATFVSSQGNLYFSDGTFGFGDKCRCKPFNVKRCLDDSRISVGNTYTARNGNKCECIFVRDGKAWMIFHGGGAAYVWNVETGENISQGGGDYNIALPERRKGSVEYVYGVPVFDTWQEDGRV